MTTSSTHYIGKLQRPNGRPENIELIVKKRANMTRAEREAGLEWVNSRYEPGDVRRYGAAIDGSTDDATAVSAWLDVGMQGVGLVHPGGNCKITSWTQKSITSDLLIVGLADAEFTGASGIEFIKPAGGLIRIINVEFDTWQSIVHNNVADSGTTTSLEFIDCVFRNCSANGIDHERPIDRFVLQNVRMFAMANYAVRIGRNTYAEQDNWKNMVIDNVYIDASTATGSTDAAGFLLYGKDAQLSNVHIGTITSDSGACWGVYTKVRYLQINNLIVDNIVTTSGTDLTGLNIKGSRKGQTTSPQGFTVIINGVTVKDTDGIGVKIQQQDVFASNIHVEEFGTDGITIDDEDSPNISLSKFKILTATTGTKVGVRITNDVGGVKVSDGYIDGPATGLRVSAVDAAGVGYQYSNLHIDNCTTGLNVNTNQAIDQIKIRDVYCGSGVTTGLLTAGTGAVTNLEIVDCDFSDASTPVTLGGTLTAPKLRNVRGYVTENAGAAASTADGGTVSHGLASTPDVVTVNPSVASEMASVTAIGSTTFTVALKQDDGTAGTSQTVYWRASMDEAL